MEKTKEIEEKTDYEIIPKNVENYIEKQIENKLNNLMETLPDKLPDKDLKKNAYNLTIRELYKNTLQTIIDIINDVIELNNSKITDVNYYITKVIYILTEDDRKLYVGIILVILSFIIYFIDGASV
jgi:hypothetical protein